jgi:serine/threonine-protein kinase
MMNRQLQIGEKIGDYSVQDFIGAGGMGEVYYAVHEKLNRAAAVKILIGMSSLNQSFKTRFFNEARLQASLHHPNIAALYDFQERGDRLFIFMEYVDGECLEDLIERRVFSVEDSLRVFAEICEAVAYIHGNGIVHRDIKALNIKLTASGTAKLLDFGIAKDAYSHNLTHTGKIIGTPHYLAPEQLEGAPASPQTDVWALGILLYKMLTNNLPFDTDSLEGLRGQISKARFNPPEELNSAVPQSVARLVQKCLCRETAKRYKTADELLADVRRILENEYKFLSNSNSGNKLFGFAGKSGSASGGFDSENNFTNQPRKSAFVPAALAAGFGVLLLFALIGIGIWAMSGGEEKIPEKVSAKTLAGETKNKPTISLQPAVSSAEPKRVRIDVIDGKADVIRNDKIVGATPFDLEAAEGERVGLTLRRAGFQDKNVQIEVSSRKKVYTFTLAPK